MAALSALFARALDHFGLELAGDVTLTDLAGAAVNLVEGAWLNQCLTTEHPCDAAEPVSEALRRSGRLLWRGATASAARA